MKKHNILFLTSDERGATALEFAALIPVLILFTFGVIEFTLALSTYLRASDAVRSAARIASLNPPVANLDDLDETPIICTGGGSVSCGSTSVANASSFQLILAEAQRILPSIEADNLIIEYSSSGVGFSTTANSTSPIMSLQLSGYEYDFILQGFVPGGGTITLPDFTTNRIISY